MRLHKSINIAANKSIDGGDKKENNKCTLLCYWIFKIRCIIIMLMLNNDFVCSVVGIFNALGFLKLWDFFNVSERFGHRKLRERFEDFDT